MQGQLDLWNLNISLGNQFVRKLLAALIINFLIQCFSREVSQNYRMEAERNYLRSPDQPFSQAVRTEQDSWDCVQLGFEDLYKWETPQTLQAALIIK